MQDELLEKTVRVNMLLDFYQGLLTEKQRMFLQYYYHDDYSLGEIAEEFKISRQAVYEHIKRAQRTLEEYESKLRLVEKHEARRGLLDELRKASSGAPGETRERIDGLIDRLISLES